MFENDEEVMSSPLYTNTTVLNETEETIFTVRWNSRVDVNWFLSILIRSDWKSPFPVNFIGFHAEYEGLKFLLVF